MLLAQHLAWGLHVATIKFYTDLLGYKQLFFPPFLQISHFIAQSQKSNSLKSCVILVHEDRKKAIYEWHPNKHLVLLFLPKEKRELSVTK